MHQNKVNSNIIVCVSGSGRSLLNLLSLEKTSSYTIKSVISSNDRCSAIEHAKKFEKEVHTFKFPLDSTSDEYESTANSVLDIVEKHDVGLIILAGFLRPFPVEKLCHKAITINIHPSLLPKFGGHGMYGMKVHDAVLKSNETKTGATIHKVTEVYDEGKIISQIEVSVKAEDNTQSLADRVFEAEKFLLPRTVDALIEDPSIADTDEIIKETYIEL